MKLVRSTDLRDHAIPYQWHADDPWLDPVTGQLTAYIAGFTAEAEAVEYGRRHGWTIEPQPKEKTP